MSARDLCFLNAPLLLKGALKNGEFEGYGSTFGNEDLGGDVVLPGAFSRTLADHRAKGTLPQMFWMHQMDQVPGKWLSMSEDEDGLKVKGVLASTTLGNDMHTLMKMDAVRGLSIGYRAKDYDWDKEGRRLLKEIELWEVSIVSLAMNPLAEITGVKSRLSARGEYVPSRREMEAKFRAMGCSQRTASTLVAKLFDGRSRDAGELHRDGGSEEGGDLGALLKSLKKTQGSILSGALDTGSLFKK